MWIEIPQNIAVAQNATRFIPELIPQPLCWLSGPPPPFPPLGASRKFLRTDRPAFQISDALGISSSFSFPPPARAGLGLVLVHFLDLDSRRRHLRADGRPVGFLIVLDRAILRAGLRPRLLVAGVSDFVLFDLTFRVATQQ